MSIRERRPGIFLVVALLAAIGGCLYDARARCSAGEQLDENDICVCLPNYVPVARAITVITPASASEHLPIDHCAPCGDNQVATNGACVCRSGYVLGPGGCVPSNLGTACTADADCASGDAKLCRLPEGYCTSQGCATNADCSKDADYACAVDPAGNYCKRPPLNQGAACTTQGVDPACGPEATVCALGACTVFGCAVDSDCSPSRKCCDVSRFSMGAMATLCLAACP
jgi:hypothetical protein